MNLDPLKILILRQINEGQPSRDDGKVALTFISAELSVDFVFVHDAVFEMYNDGLVACDQHNLKDKIKRFRLITLTDKGKEALAQTEAEASVTKFLPEVVKVVEEIALPEETRKVLLDILKCLSGNPALEKMPMSQVVKVLSRVWQIERAKVPTAI